jgi:predicted AAA+ superfamily ATPase
MMLRFYMERTRLCDDIAYWAPAEAMTTEVDFVLLRAKEVVAIEVKATRTLRPKDLRGLRAIADLPHLKRRILVFLGPRALRTEDGIDVLPLERFSSDLARSRV